MVWDISVRYHWSLFSEDETGNAVTVASVHMVNELLLPELRRRDMDIATFCFQQDGATALVARQSKNTLRNVFEHRVISRYGDISWPALSANLSACDLFSWDYLYSKGRAVAQLVEALRYKPERCEFDSRWCHWNFPLT
jgi:hypothetical protein